MGKAHNPDAGDNDSYYAYQDAKKAAQDDGKVWDKIGKAKQDEYTAKEMEKKGYEKKDGASQYTKIRSPEEQEKDKEQTANADKDRAKQQKKTDKKNAQDIKPREEKTPEEHAKMVDEFAKNIELSVEKFAHAGQTSTALEIMMRRQEKTMSDMNMKVHDIHTKADKAEENGEDDIADRIRAKAENLDDEMAQAEDLFNQMQDEYDEEMENPTPVDQSKPFRYKMGKSAGSYSADKVVSKDDKQHRYESYDPSVHQYGTDEGRKWAENMTPGQKVDRKIKEDNERKKDFVAKDFGEIIGNPLAGYPYNDPIIVKPIKEETEQELSDIAERHSDVMRKRNQSQQKAHQKAMMKSAKDSIKKYDKKQKSESVVEVNTLGNVKKALSKVKGLTADQLKTLMSIPQGQLTVIAQQLSSLVMGEEVHESQIEQHLPKLDEVMSMQTRLKMKKAFRKNKHKIAIGRKRAAKKMNLNPKKIEKRATKAARKVLEKKFLKGTDKNSLGHAGKAALEKKIEKKKSVIAKIARKLKKIIRKKESMKFKKNKETWDKAGKDLKSKK